MNYWILPTCIVAGVFSSCLINGQQQSESEIQQAPAAPAKEIQTNDIGFADQRVPSPESKVVDWTQWRGPTRDGILPNQHWPDKLDETTLTKIWSKKLGPSYSGPIVVGDQVFVTETEDKKYETVRALNRSDGSVIWQTRWEGSMSVPFFAQSNGSWIRATPIYDDGKLYVAGMLDVLVCLGAEDGKEIWKIDFAAKSGAGTPAFGAVTSPMIDGDYLFTQASGGFYKINKKTGDIIWQTLKDPGGMMGGSFSSPVIATVGGCRQAIVATRSKLSGVDLENGNVYWNQPIQTFRGMNILTPTVFKDSVFSSAYNGSSQLFAVGKDSESFAVSEKWQLAAKGYMSSPVIVDGHAYMHLQNNRLACIDLQSGQEKWRSQQRFGKYASLITSGKKILVLDQTGMLWLIKTDPQRLEIIGKQKVSDDSWAHLAVRGNEVFVRELQAMTVFRWKTP